MQNFVCGCILGRRSVMKEFLGHCEIEIDFVSRIILSGAIIYLLYYLRKESQFFCVVASCDGRVSCTSFWFTVTLTLFLE